METLTSPLADKKTRMRFNRSMREKGVAAKACGKCFVVKEYAAFSKHGKTLDGRQTYCRQCNSLVDRRWREENPGRNAEAGRRWREENRERKAENNRRWYEENPDAYRAIQRQARHRRRARKASATITPFTHDELLASWAEDDLYACAFCGGPYEEIEHVMPLSRGGEHSLDNIVPSCIECNRGVGGKHSRDPWEWLAERFPDLAPLLLGEPSAP
ncbi:HNH endonuclease [Streptomyces sp. NPDC088554]|uniref:HNH endonuclease n=1 Tax=Streptomyces sp. NPDC088554 TaxID=3365865 RepID=UPI00382FAF13